MGRNLIETIMGGVVLLVAAFFLFFAYSQADLGAVKGYTVSASFVNVGGLPNGGDVRINGIKVGSVVDQTIDNQSFNATVRMSIRNDIHLPTDTIASIASEGLLGGKYVKLDPGRTGSTIQAGGVIANSKNFKSLEEMVGEIIFLATDSAPQKDKDKEKSEVAPAAAGPTPAPEEQPK